MKLSKKVSITGLFYLVISSIFLYLGKDLHCALFLLFCVISNSAACIIEAIEDK